MWVYIQGCSGVRVFYVRPSIFLLAFTSSRPLSLTIHPRIGCHRRDGSSAHTRAAGAPIFHLRCKGSDFFWHSRSRRWYKRPAAGSSSTGFSTSRDRATRRPRQKFRWPPKRKKHQKVLFFVKKWKFLKNSVFGGLGYGLRSYVIACIFFLDFGKKDTGYNLQNAALWLAPRICVWGEIYLNKSVKFFQTELKKSPRRAIF